MSNLVDSPLVRAPHDPYWDAPLTRREAQRMVNKLASNDSELMGMCDTAALVLNFLCEAKLKVDREEIEVYVEAKKLQLIEARTRMKAAEAPSEQPA